MEELKQLHIEAGKEAGEIAVKHYIDKVWDPSIDALKVKAKDLIPGEQFDFLVDMLAGPLFPELKKLLVGGADKISEKV
jgi:hypothetical protein